MMILRIHIFLKVLATVATVFLTLAMSSGWTIGAEKLGNSPDYKGKTIRLLAGGSPGGGLDLIARTLARVFPKYIPGHPKIIVQNMPGASGVIAMNYAYNIVKPDGLTILAGLRSEVIPQLLGNDGIEYDVSKLKWLGSVNRVTNGIFVRSDLGVKSIAEMQKVKDPIVAGTTGRGGPFHLGFSMVSEAFNIPTKFIFGYRGSSSVVLAAVKGEVSAFGAALRILANMGPVKSAMRKGELLLIAQTGKKRDHLFPDVPSVWELLGQLKTAPNARVVMEVLSLQDQTGKYYALPPGTPDPLVATLRKAFWEAIHDPGFAAQLERMNQDYEPQTAKQIETLLRNALNMPAKDLQILKRVAKKQR